MKISVKENKVMEDVVLPEADGYLVQVKFKSNLFKDFRLGDCTFARSREDIKSVIDEWGAGSFVGNVFSFASEEARDKALATLKAQGFDAESCIQRGAPSVRAWGAQIFKVWPLVHGEEIPSGVTCYFLKDGRMLTGTAGKKAAEEELRSAVNKARS